MNQASEVEAECHGAPEAIGLRIETLPFADVPGQSRLFLDYLRDARSLNRFYPNAVRFHHELTAQIPDVLAGYETDRAQLCNALERMNRQWGAGSETLGQIEQLRNEKSVAVVTGQQVGLFTGPLYTIYKALTAIKVARCLTERGAIAVPVFWMATEDHDWQEVCRAEFLGCDGRLASTDVPDRLHTEGAPVGGAVLDDSVNDALNKLFEVLPTSEFTNELKAAFSEAYAPGRTFGEAFARMLTYLTKQFGLVLLDPLDAEIKRLAAPIYGRAAAHAPELATALVERSRELTDAGYHAQVLATPDAFPLFMHVAEEGAGTYGVRRALTRTANGDYEIKSNKKSKKDSTWTLDELTHLAADEPERFSPNVTLRATVQDYLLPSVCYIGGAAEIAYFAQTSETYRLLRRRATPILPRSSLTIVERRTARTLDRYDLQLPDFFAGFDETIRRVVEEHLGTETIAGFRQTEETINRSLDDLRAHLATLDPTLSDALETARRKIDYQIETLRKRFHRAQMSRDRAAHRQLERAYTALYPEQALQERRLNITSLLARHGLYCLDWLHDAADPNSNEHQIIYL